MTEPLRQQTAAPTSRPSFIRVRDFLPGLVLGERYRLGDKLAEGGMGCVYHAVDLYVGTPVAVKLLRPEVAANPELRQRFLNEARATMSIAHANVIEIRDLGELADGSTFYVMELLEGCTLDECGPLDPSAVLSIALQLCAGLAAAHDKGVVHRDLKPENVMVSVRADGVVDCKIIDFGVAKLAFTGSLTLPGQVMGTPAYLAPEQARGAAVGPRTDVYALGVLVYELIAGRLPFQCEDMLQLLMAHQFEPPPPLAGSCPPRLAAAVMRCLAKDPAQRFGSMRELAADLVACRVPSAPPPASQVSDSARTVVFTRASTPPRPPAPAPMMAAWPRPPVAAAQPWPWLLPVLVLFGLVTTLALAFAILAA
jgi:serine/threonine-protein kinase